MNEKQTEYSKDVEKWESRQPTKLPEQQESFLSAVERLAANPDVKAEKIKAMVEIHEHLLDRNAKQAFNAAMVKTQNKIKLVVAKSENAQTGSKYANLKEILIKTKPIYTAEGFSLMFYEGETSKEDHKRVCVDIMHQDGHTKKRYGDFAIQTTGIAGKAMMTQIWGEGSAFSYGRRYLTCMIFNIPTGDDDDGNAAGKEDPEPEPITKAQGKEIEKLIKDTGADETKFMIYLKNTYETAKISELNAADAIQVLLTLEAKRDFNKKEKANA